MTQKYTLLGQPGPSTGPAPPPAHPAVAEEEGRLLHPFSLEDPHAPTGSAPAPASAATLHGRSKPSGISNWKMLIKIGCAGLAIGVSLILILYLTLRPSPSAQPHTNPHHKPQSPGPSLPPASPPPSGQSPFTPIPTPSTDSTTNFTCPEGLVLQPSDLVFFIVGDWGRSGSPSQMKTADMMSQASACMAPAFVVSTGDNFYPYGLGSAGDPQVAASFTGVYRAPGLQVPWYAVLGNHDYGDSLPTQQLDACHQEPEQDPQLGATQRLAQCKGGQACCFSPLWQVRRNGSDPANGVDARWHLQQGAWQVHFDQGLDITFIDTSPFIHDYHSKHWAKLIGGISSRSGHQQREEQRALIRGLLNSSTAPIKLMVGHHPVRSNGDHCHGKASDIAECDDVGEWLRPLLEEYKVLAYFSGHEHDLQYIERKDESTVFVVSGAGSDVNHDKVDSQKHIHGSIFRDQGFVAALLRQGTLTLHYYVHGQRRPILTRTLGT